MKIAMIQMDIAWESKKANNDKAEGFIQRACQGDCDVVVFPEMFNTGCSMNVSSVAEEEDGETAAALSEWARKYSIEIIAGYPVKAHWRKGKNIACVYDKRGNRTAQFTKLHPFSFSNEHKYYISGNKLVTFHLEETACSVFICYDLRFPEIFRSIAKQVEVIFVIANWPSSRIEHWETLLKARAIENQCFIVGVNRTGVDGNGLYYPGQSHVFDPFGRNVCSGGEHQEYLSTEIDVREAKKIRERYPFLQDMRPFSVVLTE